MKTIIIAKIDTDSYDSLAKFLSETEWEKWVILDSQWWATCYWILMSRQLELYKETTTLVCSTWAYSAAFKIFHDYTWKKLMCYWSRWMRHQGHQSIEINDNWMPTYQEDKVILKNNKECIHWPFERMSDKEKKEFNKWRDVYFTFKRMKEIFPDVNILT